jgi:hypothetical protein
MSSSLVRSLADRRGGGDSKPDGDSQCLVVVEKKRWQLPSRSEAITATGTCHRLDRVSEGPETGHVPTHRARCHLETSRQLIGGPVDPPLQQAEQFQQSLRAVHPPPILFPDADRTCPHPSLA